MTELPIDYDGRRFDPEKPHNKKKRPKENHFTKGKMSYEEVKFIKENVDKLAHDEIARVLNRLPSTILAHIARNKLGKAFNRIRDKEPKKITERDARMLLRAKRFYATLFHQISKKETEFFEECWVDMMEQFQHNVLPSEEMELKEMILLEIFKNREITEEKKRRDRKGQILKEMDEIKAQVPVDKDELRSLREELLSINAACEKHANRFHSLCERSEKIRKALYASRQDRVKNVELSKVDFATWLRELEDYSTQLKVSREMTILKMAQDREKNRLTRLHKYANNEVNVPILNEDSVDLMIEEVVPRVPETEE